MRRMVITCFFAGLLALGCGDDGSSTGSGTTGDAGGTATEGTSTEGTTTEGTTTEGTTTEGTTTEGTSTEGTTTEGTTTEGTTTEGTTTAGSTTGEEATCWKPEKSESEGSFDCTAICDHVESCAGEPTDCMSSCETSGAYLTKEAAIYVHGCIVGLACEEFAKGNPLVQCVQKGLASQDLKPNPNAMADCQAVNAKFDECQLEGGLMCDAFAPVLTEETFGKAVACAAGSCDDLVLCVANSACVWSIDGGGPNQGGPHNACFMPDPPADSPIDCDAICAKVDSCSQEPDDGCKPGCEAGKSSLSSGAAGAVQTCMLDSECPTGGIGGDLFGSCAMQTALSGLWMAPAGSTEACAAVAAKMDTCGGADSTQFASGCNTFAALMTSEAYSQLGACADVACPDVFQCIEQSNCLLGLLLLSGGGGGGGDDGGGGGGGGMPPE